MDVVRAQTGICLGKQFVDANPRVSEVWVTLCLASQRIFGAMEKRTAQRTRVLKAGMIEFPGGAFSCMVRNLSDGGAALDIPSLAGIPDEFSLHLPIEGMRFQCRSVWRNERRIGVTFD
jgi:PilZ domain-containing protein